MNNLITLCKTCHKPSELGTIGVIMRIKLEKIGKDEDWFYNRLFELGMYINPYWNRVTRNRIQRKISIIMGSSRD